MHQMFYPKKVVVVGVSTRPDNMGKNILRNLANFGFQGEVYAVGREAGEIEGKPIYPSPLDLPTPVDFAVLLVPARFIPRALDECGRKGVRRVVISTGGFNEYDRGGEALAREVLAVAERHGIRFIGPNCIGITNLDNGLATPFPVMDHEAAIQGPNSIIAQSGGVKLRLMTLFSQEGLGYNKVASIGNKLDVDEVDLIEFLAGDPSTGVIFAYLEDIRRGRDLVQAIRRSPKPAVIMKANTSPQTADVASSHTAALASDDAVVDGALRQAGAIRVRGLESLITAAKAFALPSCRGDNIVVASPSGGMAVISADIAAASGFRLPALSPRLIEELQRISRAGVVRFTNPIDFGDIHDRKTIIQVILAVLKEPGTDGMALTLPTGSGGGMGIRLDEAEKLVVQVKEASETAGKPVNVALFGARGEVPQLIKATGYPVFGTIEEAIQGLAIQRDYWRNREALGL